MRDDPKVEVRKRHLKTGKTAYDLRWRDPATGRRRSRSAGTDRKRADREAALLERKLAEGTLAEIRRVSWSDFVAEVVSFLKGAHKAEAKRTLEEFGRVMQPATPRAVKPATIRAYIQKLRTGEHIEAGDDDHRKKPNSVATINKKLRYLRLAFRAGVELEACAVCPVTKAHREREDDPDVRVISNEEERAILKSAKRRYGFRYWAMVYVALTTGARRSELFGLSWARIDLDGDSPRVRFTHTKGKKDRAVPLDPVAVRALGRLRLKLATIHAGGPFIGMETSIGKRWEAIIEASGVSPWVTLHDLRRTHVTRLIRAGVPLPTVQKLAGHSSIQTTMRFYTKIDQSDAEAGAAALWDWHRRQRKIG